MSFQKNFEQELKKFERGNLPFGGQAVGNDVAFFGRHLKDARLQLAFSLGWLLTKNTYQGVDYYELVAPTHFEASRWTAIYETKNTDGVNISYPDYYFNDYALMTGSHNPKNIR